MCGVHLLTYDSHEWGRDGGTCVLVRDLTPCFYTQKGERKKRGEDSSSNNMCMNKRRRLSNDACVGGKKKSREIRGKRDKLTQRSSLERSDMGANLCLVVSHISIKWSSEKINSLHRNFHWRRPRRINKTNICYSVAFHSTHSR